MRWWGGGGSGSGSSSSISSSSRSSNIGFVQTLQHCFPKIFKTKKHQILQFIRTWEKHFQQFFWCNICPCTISWHCKQLLITWKSPAATQSPANVPKLNRRLAAYFTQLWPVNLSYRIVTNSRSTIFHFPWLFESVPSPRPFFTTLPRPANFQF